jgi:hypothetical protein
LNEERCNIQSTFQEQQEVSPEVETMFFENKTKNWCLILVDTGHGITTLFK